MGAMRPWSHRSRRSGGVHSGAQDRRMNDPPTGASLSRVVRVSIKRPGLTIGVCLALALAGLVVTARHLTFQTSSVELLPPHHIYVQRFKEYLRSEERRVGKECGSRGCRSDSNRMGVAH